MDLFNWIDFQILGDERGSLVALEQGSSVPFDIKRVYYIYHTIPEVSRGFHAHKALKQVAICVSGACRMVLDDGETRQETWMNSPTKGLLIDSMIWREMHDFSQDCILLVLASDHYDESDYIRNFFDFLSSKNLEIGLAQYDEELSKHSWPLTRNQKSRPITTTQERLKNEVIKNHKTQQHENHHIIFGISYGRFKIGTCGLININFDTAEAWLNIEEKRLWRADIAKKILHQLEEHARSASLKRLTLKVSLKNTHTQRLYLKTGYIITAQNNERDKFYTMEKLL